MTKVLLPQRVGEVNGCVSLIMCMTSQGRRVVLIAELLTPWYKHRIDYAYSKVLNN